MAASCSAPAAATASSIAGARRWPRCTAATATAGTSASYLDEHRARQHALGAARRTGAVHALGIRRPQPIGFHHLWTTNPDGTGQMVYFGNQHPGTRCWMPSRFRARERVVASFSPGHGRPEHMGVVTIVDPDRGPDDRVGPADQPAGQMFRDPYPISGDCFLVADARGICGDGRPGKHGSILPGALGGRGPTAVPRTSTAAAAAAGTRDPLPRERESKPRAGWCCSDVYAGRNMAGVQRGEIKEASGPGAAARSR